MLNILKSPVPSNYFLRTSEVIGSESTGLFVVLEVVMPCRFQEGSFPHQQCEKTSFTLTPQAFDAALTNLGCIAILIDVK